MFFVLVMRAAAILFSPLVALVGSVFDFIHVLIIPLLLGKHEINRDRGLLGVHSVAFLRDGGLEAWNCWCSLWVWCSL